MIPGFCRRVTYQPDTVVADALQIAVETTPELEPTIAMLLAGDGQRWQAWEILNDALLDSAGRGLTDQQTAVVEAGKITVYAPD